MSLELEWNKGEERSLLEILVSRWPGKWMDLCWCYHSKDYTYARIYEHNKYLQQKRKEKKIFPELLLDKCKRALLEALNRNEELETI